MERDFMGLNSKEPMASVKREISDEGPEVHWPSSMKNASSHPNFMSFRTEANQEDGMKKMNPPLTLSNPLWNPSFTSYGQNVTAAMMSQQFPGIPMTMTSPVGFTDPWNNKMSPAAPSQMTIFYAGNVSVYDGITPEKAQAIMLLAGNGTSLTSNMTLARPPVMSSVIRASPTVTDAAVQSSTVVVGKDEQLVTKTTGISSATLTKPEPQRGAIPMSVMTPSAVPQFRKASLARFLEKRKERVLSAAPYNCNKKPVDTPGANNLGSASTSAANSMTSA